MYNFFVIIMTLLVALILTLLPMPDWAIWLRPAWVLMVLIYWSIMMPHQISVGTAWIIGLILDLLTGSLLGEHAFALTLVVYFVARIHIRLRMFPIIQQALCVGIFVLLYQFVLYCIQGFIGNLPSSNVYWFSSVISMLLWPWFFVLMNDMRFRFKIA